MNTTRIQLPCREGGGNDLAWRKTTFAISLNLDSKVDIISALSAQLDFNLDDFSKRLRVLFHEQEHQIMTVTTSHRN